MYPGAIATRKRFLGQVHKAFREVRECGGLRPEACGQDDFMFGSFDGRTESPLVDVQAGANSEAAGSRL